MCCSLWGCRESDTAKRLYSSNNNPLWNDSLHLLNLYQCTQASHQHDQEVPRGSQGDTPVLVKACPQHVHR